MSNIEDSVLMDFFKTFVTFFDYVTIYSFDKEIDLDNDLFIEDKHSFLAQNIDSFIIIFPYCSKKKYFRELVNDFDFLFSILDFFNKYCKVYYQSKVQDFQCESIISIALQQKEDEEQKIYESKVNEGCFNNLIQTISKESLLICLISILKDMNKDEITAYQLIS